MARIMIADDSFVTRQVLATILEAVGHQVVGSYDNGRAVMAALEGPLPDLLLVDMLMPQASGVEVARTLRARGVDLKIVMISSVTVLEKIREAKEAGVNYYVLKPFEARKVLDVVDRCLAGMPVAV
jgi:CheY-like chemotaxis protein